MAKTIEQWLATVFPGERQVYDAYIHLPPRELVIVAAAVLDSALVELLTLRLTLLKKEQEEFLGLTGSGMAPAGSFGARIQLALLTGLITDFEAKILKNIQKLRNKFAHRVTVSFSDPDIMSLLLELYHQWLDLIKPKQSLHVDEPQESKEFRAEYFKLIEGLKPVILKDPRFGALPIIMLLGSIQLVWHKLAVRIPRIVGVE